MLNFESKKNETFDKCYGFFDGEDVTKYCVPKLLEISMNFWYIPGWRKG